MAYQSIWYFSNLPEEIVDIVEKDLGTYFDSSFQESKLDGDVVNTSRRNSTNTWVPSHHWIVGFLWHYVNKANNENFMFDLTNIDCESVQYTQYAEGQYYKWHSDSGLYSLTSPGTTDTLDKQKQKDIFAIKNSELIRKLSFVMQLSSADDYEGGNLQILDDNGNSYFAPRARGSIILFDSRSQHRVTPVKGGIRKSIVGWVVGPRWK